MRLKKTSSRGLGQLLTYWEEQCGDKIAPRWRDIYLMDIPAEIRAGLAVYDYSPEQRDFRVRFWGFYLPELFGFEITGKWVSKVDHLGFLDVLVQCAWHVISTKKVDVTINRTLTFYGTEGVHPVIHLPTSDDGTNVTKIISARNSMKLGLKPTVSDPHRLNTPLHS